MQGKTGVYLLLGGLVLLPAGYILALMVCCCCYGRRGFRNGDGRGWEQHLTLSRPVTPTRHDDTPIPQQHPAARGQREGGEAGRNTG